MKSVPANRYQYSLILDQSIEWSLGKNVKLKDICGVLTIESWTESLWCISENINIGVFL